MRDILKKATTGAMIAGAALLVAACGGETAANNTMADDLGNDVSMDANMGDMGLDANMSTDMNMTTDMNMVDTNMTMDANASTTNAAE
jgi:hypothetical protein